MGTTHRFPAGRVALVAGLALALGACNTLTRLSEIGKGPDVSEIANPTTRPQYRPVSMPMPQPEQVSHNPNSLWRTGARAFFRDQRATEVGDILTVTLAINDNATLENNTTRQRDDSEAGAINNLFGLEAELSKVLPQGVNPAATVGISSDHNTSGDGEIERSEAISMKVAAVITQILPNGNLVVFGRQEVRVNYELREVMVTGIVRPADIDYTNTISHEKIAELRVAYGGRGTLSDIQQPRWGTQLMDVIFPF